MAKKRGGLAGVWDRNKGVIKTVAPIAAGFIPGVGPLAGAALGAAMRGLDRPGKGGIGLDIGGAVRGGLEGYGGAKLGQAAKGLFTGGAAAAGAKRLAQGTQTMNKGLAMLPGAPTAAATVAPPAMDVIGSGVSAGSKFGNVRDLFGKGGIIENNKTILSGIGKGIMGVRQGALDQQAADATLNQRKYEFDKTYGLDAAQEADRKRREDEVMAQRAAFRAMFTGTA